MLLRKLLFIIVSCEGCSTKVSLGRKKPFQTLPPFMWDGLSTLLWENCIIVQSRPGKLHLSKTELLESACSLYYFPYRVLSPLLSSPRNKTSTVWFILGPFCWGLFSFFEWNTIDTLLRKAFVGELQVYAFSFTNNWRLKCKWGCWYLSSLYSFG